MAFVVKNPGIHPGAGDSLWSKVSFIFFRLAKVIFRSEQSQNKTNGKLLETWKSPKRKGKQRPACICFSSEGGCNSVIKKILVVHGADVRGERNLFTVSSGGIVSILKTISEICSLCHGSCFIFRRRPPRRALPFLQYFRRRLCWEYF